MAQAALTLTPSRAISPVPVLRGSVSTLSSGGGVEFGESKTFGQVFRAQTDVASVPVALDSMEITKKDTAASLAKGFATDEGKSAKAKTDIATSVVDAGHEAGMDGERLGFIGSTAARPVQPQESLKSARIALNLTSADGAGASDAVQGEGTSGKEKSVKSGDEGKSEDEKKNKDSGVEWKSAEMASATVPIQGMAQFPAVVAVQAAAPVAVPVVVSVAGTSVRTAKGVPHTLQATPVSGLAQSAISGAGGQSEVATKSSEKPASVSEALPRNDALAGKALAVDEQSKAAASPVMAPALSGAVLPGVMASGITASGDGKTVPGEASHEARSLGDSTKVSGLMVQTGTQISAQPGAVAVLATTSTSGPAVHPALNQAAVSTSGAVAVSATSTSPYARMDQMSQGSAPVVLHSGAQQVAVGVQDASLGWVEIRTQNVSGHVDATLVAASGATQSALAAQLPAMAQFVAQHDVRLGSLAVQQAASNFNSGLNSGTGFGSGSGQNGPGQNYPGQSGGNPSGGFTPGALMGGSGNPAGGSHSRSARSGSGFSSGRSVGGVPAAGVPAASSSYGDSEDAALRPVSYISVRV